MTVTVAGKTYDLTDCQNLDRRHCDLSGRPYCRIKGYVNAVKTGKRPDGCKCKSFSFALPEKELAIRKIDFAYACASSASINVSMNELSKARMEVNNALVVLDSSLELIEKMQDDILLEKGVAK